MFPRLTFVNVIFPWIDFCDGHSARICNLASATAVCLIFFAFAAQLSTLNGFILSTLINLQENIVVPKEHYPSGISKINCL